MIARYALWLEPSTHHTARPTDTWQSTEGRKGPSSAAATAATKAFAEKLGHTAKVRDDLKGLTLNQFYKDYASRGGIWVVFIRGHAIGFRDGKTLDWTGDEVTGKIVRRKTAKVGYRADSAVIQIKG